MKFFKRIFTQPAYLVGLVSFAWWLLWLPTIPWTDDARFYVPSAIAIAQWFENILTGLWHGDYSAWSQSVIDNVFAQNREHPPVAKYVMALGWLFFHHWLPVASDIVACRLAVGLLWAGFCSLLFVAIRPLWQPTAALFAVAFINTLPRFFFDAHAETLDAPVAMFLFAATYFTWSAWENPGRKNLLLATFSFALALGTKLNAPFFLLGCFFYYVLVHPPYHKNLSIRWAPIPWVAVCLIGVAPLVTWFLWPWLWTDTTVRLADYLRFHMRHYPIYFYYAGQNYRDTVAPWTAPMVMLFLTTPLVHLLVAALGSLRPLWHGFSRLPGVGTVDNALWSQFAQRADLRFLLFVLVQFFVQLFAPSLPHVPYYGGVKLIAPVFGLLAVLAGYGFFCLHNEWENFVTNTKVRQFASYGFATWLVVPGLLGLVAYHHRWLSYYNEWVGGVRGAATAGFERQYYDLAYPALVEALQKYLPHGGNVALVPNGKEYVSYIERWQHDGVLSSGVRATDETQADLIILSHERRWQDYPTLRARLRTHTLLESYTIADVPLFSIYHVEKN